MLDFTYQSPVKLYFGKGEEQNIGKYVREYGGSRVLLHYGGGSVVRSGLMRLVREKLEAEGMAVFELGGAQPNPRVELAAKGSACAAERAWTSSSRSAAAARWIPQSSSHSAYATTATVGHPDRRAPARGRPLPSPLSRPWAATGSENNGIFVITNRGQKARAGHASCRPEVLHPQPGADLYRFAHGTPRRAQST